MLQYRQAQPRDRDQSLQPPCLPKAARLLPSPRPPGRPVNRRILAAICRDRVPLPAGDAAWDCEQLRGTQHRNSGFINKGFREKAVLRVVNTAPGSERNMYRTADVANILRGNPVGDQRSLNWFVLVRIGIFPRDQPVYCRKLPEIDSVRQAGRNPDGRLLHGTRSTGPDGQLSDSSATCMA